MLLQRRVRRGGGHLIDSSLAIWRMMYDMGDLAKLTRQKLRTNAQAGEILDTLLQMVNVITTSR